MVHRSAAPAPPRTARRTVTYEASYPAILRWPRARITLQQRARVVMKSWTALASTSKSLAQTTSPGTWAERLKKRSALHDAEPTIPMTVLICGSPASGFQIIGLFANSGAAQSYAQDYSLKDWWVAELISPGAFAEASKSHP
jgi:hypothetical protein